MNLNNLSGRETVESYLTDLIQTYKYDHYADLAYTQKCEAVALLIQEYPLQDIYECFVESDVVENMAAIIISFQKNTAASREVMAETIQKNILKYFEKKLEITFNECLENIEAERQTWAAEVRRWGDPDHDYDRYRERYA